MKAPEQIETARLMLRRPVPEDAAAIFERYASDPEVTRFLSWPRHQPLAATRDFIAFSDAEWARAPAGPYLIASRDGDRLLGSTGLSFQTGFRAETGYVLAVDAWGQGYAAEALRAMLVVARSAGVVRVQALCHADHRRSHRVLEKCGFEREGLLRQYAEFPNLTTVPCDVVSYAITGVALLAAGNG